MSEYQNRVDIDKIYDEFYDYTGKTRVVVFLEGSKYRVSSETDPEKDNSGTIDGIIEYYRLHEVADRLDELSSSIIDMVYPIGTLYQTTDNSFDPNITFGGVWENISNANSIYVWERVIETE